MKLGGSEKIEEKTSGPQGPGPAVCFEELIQLCSGMLATFAIHRLGLREGKHVGSWGCHKMG